MRQQLVRLFCDRFTSS